MRSFLAVDSVLAGKLQPSHRVEVIVLDGIQPLAPSL